MKFTITPFLSTILLSLSITGIPISMNTNTNIKVKSTSNSLDASLIPGPSLLDPTLIPEFGVEAGQNPTGTGDCDGINNAVGQPIKIPCSCPPDRNTFIQALNENVALGHAVNNPGVTVTFPTDDSDASKAARIQASLVTLQNLNGPGVGCPAASTTLLAQLNAIL